MGELVEQVGSIANASGADTVVIDARRVERWPTWPEMLAAASRSEPLARLRRHAIVINPSDTARAEGIVSAMWVAGLQAELFTDLASVLAWRKACALV